MHFNRFLISTDNSATLRSLNRGFTVQESNCTSRLPRMPGNFWRIRANYGRTIIISYIFIRGATNCSGSRPVLVDREGPPKGRRTIFCFRNLSDPPSRRRLHCQTVNIARTRFNYALFSRSSTEISVINPPGLPCEVMGRPALFTRRVFPRVIRTFRIFRLANRPVSFVQRFRQINFAENT